MNIYISLKAIKLQIKLKSESIKARLNKYVLAIKFIRFDYIKIIAIASN